MLPGPLVSALPCPSVCLVWVAVGEAGSHTHQITASARAPGLADCPAWSSSSAHLRLSSAGPPGTARPWGAKKQFTFKDSPEVTVTAPTDSRCLRGLQCVLPVSACVRARAAQGAACLGSGLAIHSCVPGT